MESYKAVILNIPFQLLDRLNHAARGLSLSRSELIRRSLSRDLDFVLQQEVPRLSKAREEASYDYARWLEERLEKQKAAQGEKDLF